MDKKENQATEERLMSNKPYKRRVRNILIHKPMQREFTFVMISLLMVSTLAVGFVIHETIREAALGGGFHFGKINPYEVISEVSYQLMLRVSSILFVSLVVIGVFGIFFLHRVAGPVYRFRQIFMRINDGEYPNFIKLREGDFFMETASEINQLIQKLRFEEDKSRRMKAKLGDLLDKMEPSHPFRKEVEEVSLMLNSEVE